MNTIDQITAIHQDVEQSRGWQIPDWAYRDVLFMLIDYSIRSFELLERKLSYAEKEEVFNVFYQVGMRMKLNGLPLNFNQWQAERTTHLHQHLASSNFTIDLYRQYRKHLGFVRYQLLKQAQIMVVPQIVKQMLHLSTIAWICPLIGVYKLIRIIRLENLLKHAILPAQYRKQITDLDRAS